MTLISQNPLLFPKLLPISAKAIFLTLIWVFSSIPGLLPESVLAKSSRRRVDKSTSVPQTEVACSENQETSNPLSNIMSIVPQISTWVIEPNESLQDLGEKFGPYILALMNRPAWPNINEQAKLGKVPIVMYHDILPKKEVFFDVTPTELEAHFQLIKDQGVTPISLDQLMVHLQSGIPLPAKPILLSFDDGYGGHFEYVYPLLKKYGYPAVFSIYTKGVGVNSGLTLNGEQPSKSVGRSHVNWEQLQQMAADPLVTIASHSISHPADLSKLPEEQLRIEIGDSKRTLETKLGIPIRYFTYPVGKYNDLVTQLVAAAGYELALTMSDTDERFAGASDNLLTVSRFGQSKIEDVITQAWGGSKLPNWQSGFDFNSTVQKVDTTIDKIPLILISGGKPITIHADSRYQLSEVVAKSGTPAIAAVDGTFFSLKYLNSNVMVGSVLSQVTNQFIPGNSWDVSKIAGRPLVLISASEVKYIPFDPQKHNNLEGIRAEMPEVTDAFVAGAWLVKDSQPQPAETFQGLYGFNEARYRAFWGINQDKQPTVGISRESVGAVALGIALAKAGLKDAVMLDSGQSTSLTFQGKSLVNYTPRPVPHAIALIPPLSQSHAACVVADQTNEKPEDTNDSRLSKSKN